MNWRRESMIQWLDLGTFKESIEELHDNLSQIIITHEKDLKECDPKLGLTLLELEKQLREFLEKL